MFKKVLIFIILSFLICVLNGATSNSESKTDLDKRGRRSSLILASSSHNLLIDNSGQLWVWGQNNYGQLGNGTNGFYDGSDYDNSANKNIPTKIAERKIFTSVAAGLGHSLAIDNSGQLWTWGQNYYGQLGDGTGGNLDEDDYKNTPTKISEGKIFTSVAACIGHILAIDNSGQLWAWGWNEYSQLGDGTTGGNKTTPTKIKEGTIFTSVAAGFFHSLAIDNSGQLWAWGSNSSGQVGDGTIENIKNTPTKIKEGTKFITVAAGWNHSLAIDNSGQLWTWGQNNDGQLGDGTSGEENNKNTPTKIKEGTKFTTVSAGVEHSLAIDNSGQLWVWGWNRYSQLGDGTYKQKNTPTKIKKGTKFTTISAGSNHSLAIDNSGQLWAWGSNNYGQLGDGTIENIKNTPTKIKEGTKFTTVAAGWNHSLAIDNLGQLWTWGKNDYGQVGDGTSGEENNKNTPTKIAEGTKFTTVSAGVDHSLAIDNLGQLWVWGYNGYSQLGDGTYKQKNTPTKIKKGTKFTTISAGSNHSLAIDNSGQLWAWGWNESGELGNGTSGRENGKNTPVKIEIRD